MTTKFSYPEPVLVNGTVDSDATLNAVELAIDSYNEGVRSSLATVREHATAVFAEAKASELRKDAIAFSILQRMNANAQNAGQLKAEIDAGLAMCLIGSVNGSRLATEAEVLSYKAERAARKAAKQSQ